MIIALVNIVIGKNYNVNNQYVFAEINNCENPQGNNCEKMKLIKNNFIIGKKYYKVMNAILFKKVLSGAWSSPPHAGVKFYNNGSFSIDYMIGSHEYTKSGIWNVRNNVLLLKYKGEEIWNEHRLKQLKLKDAKRLPGAEYLEFSYRYTFEILFDKGVPNIWQGDLIMEFN